MPGMPFHREPGTLAPLLQAGGKSNQIEIAIEIRPFEKSSAIAHYCHAQGRVLRRIGFDQSKQLGFQPVGVFWKRNVHQSRVAAHPLPMPLEGEQNSVRYPHSTEHSPAV